MSTNSFNKRARLNIIISINGGGAFWPFPDGYGSPCSWSIQGDVVAEQFAEETTVKQDTCGVAFGEDKQFRSFGAQGSTGGTSGTIKVGQYPNFQTAETVLGPYLGTWQVNTKPVLAAEGKIGDEEAPDGHFVVLLPTAPNAKIDDPIVINPKIDDLERVYPGDRVYTSGKGIYRKWRVAPQKRYPKTDRTFFWVPNTNPVIKSGGLVSNELALPGTIMIPTKDFYIEDADDAVDGMRYFYENQGVMFDGQTWTKLLADPVVYEPEQGPKEFRNMLVYYASEDFFENRMEADHWQKPFIYTNQRIKLEDKPQFSYTFEGQETETEDMTFKWYQPMNGVDSNIQPGIPVIYNFGDAWSAYHLNNKQWFKTKFPGTTGAGFSLTSDTSGNVLSLGVEDFEDGEVTEIKETYTDPEGNELENVIAISLTVTAYME